MPKHTLRTSSTSPSVIEADLRLLPLPERDLRAIIRAMLNASHAGVLVSGVDNVAKACNSEFGRIFGIDPDTVPETPLDELRTHAFPRLQHPDQWLERLNTVYAQPELTYSDELELVAPAMWIRRTSGPLIDTTGAILGRLWTFEDITEEHARTKRREVTQRLSTYHDPDPAVVYREVIRAVADLYKTTTILSIADGDMMLFKEVALPPPGAEHVPGNQIKESFCQLVMEDCRPVLVQDGRLHPRVCEILPVRLGFVRYLGVPILNSQGDPIGTMCIMDNRCDELLGPEDQEFMALMGNRVSVELERERLFELRTADQKLALERQAVELTQTGNVLRAMNEGMALVDSARSEDDLIGRYQSLLEGLLGFQRVSLHAGKPIHNGALAESWSLEGDQFSLEFWGASEPRSELFQATHVSALADHVALTLATFRFQRELKEAHDTLRGAQGRLVQAEKLGVVGTLAATVAHDIRNILASIEVEASSEGDPAETLERVRLQVARFSVLSHRLLSYVKPKFVARENLNVNDIVRRALELLEPQIRASRAKLSVDLTEPMKHVDADPNQVEHLFVNLIVNALQAVSRASGALTIRSTVERGLARFVVKDNGRGIPPDAIAKVFDPFYSSRADGFGLGLYSCRRIAKDHGWQLEVASNVGAGTEFVLTIPAGGKA
ncbi:MAG TPA: ATP-binding protein [Fimbriimonadaceae bacterium]|nr:ATP-binding protein [Fimbriimonadaceae bacterium]